VIFTFDDGSKSHVRAAQLLDKYGFKGIFFVIPERITETHERFLTKGEIRLLAEHGHLIGVHGFQHKSMVDSVGEFSNSQERSENILRTIIGDKQHSISDLAFPFGYYDDQIVKRLRHNYKYLHTVNPGYWDGKSILIPRVLVDSHTDIEFFKDYIKGSTGFSPRASLITEDGMTCDIVEFRLHSKINLDKMELFSVSRDTSGQINISHPLGDNLSSRNNVIRINIKNHLRRYYSPDRRVISYALVSRENGGIRFLTFGHMHWVTK
jgi:peptidoglycan/xylan/chitin deacetylase (PgdA/CDA1 family)